MYNMLHKIIGGNATKVDLDMLIDLCDLVKNTSLCGLGQSAPNPVESTLHFFQDEYMAKLTTESEESAVPNAMVEEG
jgi:bidirectional [NiFe] hydrogenase diaphorase subunit